jgi:hypothetical protein
LLSLATQKLFRFTLESGNRSAPSSLPRCANKETHGTAAKIRQVRRSKALVGGRNKRGRYCDAAHLRSFEVDYKLKRGRLFDGQIGWPGTFRILSM